MVASEPVDDFGDRIRRQISIAIVATAGELHQCERLTCIVRIHAALIRVPTASRSKRRRRYLRVRTVELGCPIDRWSIPSPRGPVSSLRFGQ